MKASSLRDIILTLAAGGLEILERTTGRRQEDIVAMCRRLVHLKGEASAISLADKILTTYKSLSTRNRLQFFERLLTEFMPDSRRLDDAIAAYQRDPNANTAAALQGAAESPRQELFRVLNMGPDGPASIQDVLSAKNPGEHAEIKADAAIFYSINNCQPGLAGVSFGNFLIKQVTDSLAEEIPSLKYYATLSPVPGFRAWLKHQLTTPQHVIEFSEPELLLLSRLEGSSWCEDDLKAQQLKPLLLYLCAYYLLYEKRGDE